MAQRVSIWLCTVHCLSSAQLANRNGFTLTPIQIMNQSCDKTKFLLFFCNHFDMSSDGPDVFMYISKCGDREEMLGVKRVYLVYTQML